MLFIYCWRNNAESPHLMSKRMSNYHSLPLFLLTLTISIFLSLTVLFLVPLITRTRCVQAPVQDVTQQCLLLLGQLCCGCGHKALSVGLQSVIPSPWDRNEQSLRQRNGMQMAQTRTFWENGSCLSNMFVKTWVNWPLKYLFWEIEATAQPVGKWSCWMPSLCSSPSPELMQLCPPTHPQYKKNNADIEPIVHVNI